MITHDFPLFRIGVGSNGSSGIKLLKYLERFVTVSPHAKEVLLGAEFRAAPIALKVGLIRGERFESKDRNYEDVFVYGLTHGYTYAPIESACIARTMRNGVLGLNRFSSLVFMHNPINTGDGPRLLCLMPNHLNLGTCKLVKRAEFDVHTGFVFAKEVS